MICPNGLLQKDALHQSEPRLCWNAFDERNHFRLDLDAWINEQPVESSSESEPDEEIISPATKTANAFGFGSANYTEPEPRKSVEPSKAELKKVP